MILGGCANDKQLREAGVAIGTSNARVTLPELPAECKRQYGQIPVRAGYEAVVAIKKGNSIIAAGNRDNVNCEAWYKDLSGNLAGVEAPAVIVPQR